MINKPAKIDLHIDHNDDEYAMELQRSPYIKIDDAYESGNTQLKISEADDINLKFKFCKPIDVDSKFIKIVNYKARFLTKMQHLKINGEK